MKRPQLSTLEWSIKPFLLLVRPRVPGLTPGLDLCLVPMGRRPCFLLSIPFFPPSRTWKSAHKPKLRGWSLLTADRLSNSLISDYISQCHLFPDRPVPAPPSLETCHPLPNINYTCPGDCLSSASIFLCISLLLPCLPLHSTCPIPVGGSSQFACVLQWTGPFLSVLSYNN